MAPGSLSIPLCPREGLAAASGVVATKRPLLSTGVARPALGWWEELAATASRYSRERPRVPKRKGAPFRAENRDGPEGLSRNFGALRCSTSPAVCATRALPRCLSIDQARILRSWS